MLAEDLKIQVSSYKLGGHRGHPRNLAQKFTWANAGGGGEGAPFLGLVREGASEWQASSPGSEGYRVTVPRGVEALIPE